MKTSPILAASPSNIETRKKGSAFDSVRDHEAGGTQEQPSDDLLSSPDPAKFLAGTPPSRESGPESISPTQPLPPQEFHRRVRKEIVRIIKKKEEEGLKTWALRKMGKDRLGYLTRAKLNYLTLVQADLGLTDATPAGWPPNRVAKTPEDKVMVQDFIERRLIEACQRAPYVIPVRLRRKSGISMDPVELLREYEILLPRIRSRKTKTRRNPAAQKMALMEILDTSNKILLGKYRRLGVHLGSTLGAGTNKTEALAKLAERAGYLLTLR